MVTVSIKIESDVTLKQDAIEAAHELKSPRKQPTRHNTNWRVWLRFPIKLFPIKLNAIGITTISRA